jgi:hypothetical protein
MIKETIYQVDALYREPMDILGYRFGKGQKAACIVGAIRGNEMQQLYVCSKVVKALSALEKSGGIISNKEVLVVPSLNPYSMNIEKRFWALDNTDINRKFPGNKEGETTARIAASVLDTIGEYTYGIQFTSFYMSGDFIPHIRMMDTGYQNTSLANLFGLPYVVIREPKPYDTRTLNFNWQMKNTHAFSVYTTATEQIDETSANQAVAAVFRFLTRMGIIRYPSHSGYIASILKEEDLMSVKTTEGGIYRRLKNPGDEVVKGDLLAEILHPYEGHVVSEVYSPMNGIIFFAHQSPMVAQNCVVYKMIKRLHN